MSRQRLTDRSRSRGDVSLLAEIDELERRISADNDRKTERQAQEEQNTKVDKNRSVSASDKQRIARRLVSLASALITE